MNRPTLVDTKEAARRSFVVEGTIRKWVQRGWLTVAIKDGRRNYYWLDDVLEVDRRARRGAVLADRS